MSSLVLALIVTLVRMLALVSGLAGALWWRLRSMPPGNPASLADELAGLVHRLEGMLERLEPEAPGRPRHAAAPKLAARAQRVVFSLAKAQPSTASDEAPAAPTLITVPGLADAPHTASTDPASSDLGQRFAAVWELADAGASPEAIARRTGHPIGQVELILGLRRQLETAAAAATGGRRP
jgi:hypothetical protein